MPSERWATHGCCLGFRRSGFQCLGQYAGLGSVFRVSVFRAIRWAREDFGLGFWGIQCAGQSAAIAMIFV